MLVALGGAAHSAPLTGGTLVIDTPVEGAEVQIDGVLAGVTPLPGPWTLPAGAHTVSVTAPGQPPKTFSVTIQAGKQSKVAVLQPAEAPAPVAAVEQRVVHTGPGFSLSTAGYVTAGIGLAAIGAGVYFGLSADDSASQARALSPQDPGATRAGQQGLIDDADRAAFTANLLYGVGGAAVLAGAALALWAPDGLLASGVTVSPTLQGAALVGRF